MLRGTLTPLLMALAVVALSAGCDAISGSGDDDSSAAPIKLTGTSGNDVSLNGTWTRGCLSGDWGTNESVWKVDGGTLTGTATDFTGTGCDAGNEAVETKVKAVITDDDVMVTISDWIDSSGAAAAAPAGLEDVTKANGVSVGMESATLEPLTSAAASDLNTRESGAGYCGETDWASGTAKDVVECWFGTANPDPGKSSIVLDDTTSADQVSWYESPDDAAVKDADGYPTEIENFDPLMK